MTKQNIECNHEWTDQREYGYLCRKCKVRGEKVHPPKVECKHEGLDYEFRNDKYLNVLRCSDCMKLVGREDMWKSNTTPKVELPEWGNEYILFERPTISIHKFMAQKSSGIFYEMKEERLDTLLSHSTTQLVEKIMGEVEGLKKKKLKHFGGFEDIKSEDYENTPFGCGFNQCISKALEIISKYK